MMYKIKLNSNQDRGWGDTHTGKDGTEIGYDMHYYTRRALVRVNLEQRPE